MADHRQLRNAQRRDGTRSRSQLTPPQRRRRKKIVAAAKNIAAIVGFLGGIVGLLGGGYSLKDRWFPPTIEVLDLTPTYISDPSKRDGVYGVGMVLHVKTQSRPVSITGLELEGKRCLSFNEWLGYAQLQGKQLTGDRHVDDLMVEFNQVKPFERVSFSGRLTDRNSPLVLNAWEEQYIPFTLVDLTEESPVEGIDLKFFGSIEHAPLLIRRYGITVLDVFATKPAKPSAQSSWAWTVTHLRNEILDGVMIFRLLAGATQSSIPQDIIHPLRRVQVSVWKTGSIATIMSERWPPSEIKPSINKQINCYQQPSR